MEDYLAKISLFLLHEEHTNRQLGLELVRGMAAAPTALITELFIIYKFTGNTEQAIEARDLLVQVASVALQERLAENTTIFDGATPNNLINKLHKITVGTELENWKIVLVCHQLEPQLWKRVLESYLIEQKIPATHLEAVLPTIVPSLLNRYGWLDINPMLIPILGDWLYQEKDIYHLAVYDGLELEYLPDGIDQLEQLHSLDLEDIYLKTTPLGWTDLNLRMLKMHNVWWDDFDTMLTSITAIQSLEQIYLTIPHHIAVPPIWHRLEKLKKLTLYPYGDTQKIQALGYHFNLRSNPKIRHANPTQRYELNEEAIASVAASKELVKLDLITKLNAIPVAWCLQLTKLLELSIASDEEEIVFCIPNEIVSTSISCLTLNANLTTASFPSNFEQMTSLSILALCTTDSKERLNISIPISLEVLYWSGNTLPQNLKKLERLEYFIWLKGRLESLDDFVEQMSQLPALKKIHLVAVDSYEKNVRKKLRKKLPGLTISGAETFKNIQGHLVYLKK